MDSEDLPGVAWEEALGAEVLAGASEAVLVAEALVAAEPAAAGEITDPAAAAYKNSYGKNGPCFLQVSPK